MYFKLITLTLALAVLGRAASVPDLKGSTVEAVAVNDISHLSNAIPVHAPPSVASDEPGKIPALKGLSTTSANSAFRALASNLNQLIYVCTLQGCNGTCYTYDPNSLTPFVCYPTAGYFTSMYAYSAGGFALPYGIYVGQVGCSAAVQLPAVNTCYNLFYNGAAAYDSTLYIT